MRFSNESKHLETLLIGKNLRMKRLNINSNVLILRGIFAILCLVMSFHLDLSAQEQVPVDSVAAVMPINEVVSNTNEVTVPVVEQDSITADIMKTAMATDSISAKDSIPSEFQHKRIFNPDPTKAVWMSALCPGLGQIYNRRYWKIPIVIGGYVGLAYATSWNGRMLKDYTRAYRDIMDSDPNTNSYMDFYPSTTQEADIDKEWLKRSLKSKKDFYRRNRDLCVISMVGLYFICMVDAYVDASLSKFDISPNLSVQFAPTVVDSEDSRNKSMGVQCAFIF